jgi:ketosteroid isomerase-like protein
MNLSKLLVACAVHLAVVATPRDAAAQVVPAPGAGADSIAVVRTVERFHAALSLGDIATVAALLDSSAVVLESGEYETRSDYLHHHLPADIGFARAVPSTRQVRRVAQRGSAAWVVSTSRASGTFNGRPVNSDGAELMVLTRTTAGWRIAAIHWSSHRRTK